MTPRRHVLQDLKNAYLQYLGIIHAANHVQSGSLTAELEFRIRAKGCGAVLDYFKHSSDTREISNLMGEGLTNIIHRLVLEDPKGISSAKYPGLVLTTEGAKRVATLNCGPEIFEIMPALSTNQVVWLRNLLRVERDPAYG